MSKLRSIDGSKPAILQVGDGYARCSAGRVHQGHLPRDQADNHPNIQQGAVAEYTLIFIFYISGFIDFFCFS